MDYGVLIIGLVVGMAVGAVSMFSLWITVHWLPNAQRPLVVLATSAGIRLVAMLSSFYFLAQLGPFALLGGLFGFVVARTIAIRRTRSDAFSFLTSTRMENR